MSINGKVEKQKIKRGEMETIKPKDDTGKTPDEFGTGDFYHIEVRPKQAYKTFRSRDVGEKTGIERVGGQREDGVWETVKWLVRKDLARVEGGRLVAECRAAQELFDRFASEPKHIEGTRFEAQELGDGAKGTTAATGKTRTQIIE